MSSPKHSSKEQILSDIDAFADKAIAAIRKPAAALAAPQPASPRRVSDKAARDDEPKWKEQPAKAAQDSPLVELGRAAVTAEAELELVKQQLETAQMYLESAEAQRDKAEQLNSELLAALKRFYESRNLANVVPEQECEVARSAIARAEGRAS